MLTDGLTLLGDTNISRAAESKGTSFPPVPVDRQVFELTQDAGAYAAGVYIYLQELGDWKSSTTVIPHDLSAYIADAPAPDSTVFAIIYSTGTRLLLDQARVSAAVAAGTTTTYTLKHNSTAVATLTFSSGNTEGAISAASNVAVLPGDMLELTAGSTSDQSISGISLSIPGVVIS